MATESLRQKIDRVVVETVEIVDYDPTWPEKFAAEKAHLLADLPDGMIVRIEHFGSTAVVGLAAKPVVDMVVEVADVQRAKVVVPEILEPQGYDCFWRPTSGDDTPPWHTWCIARDAAGRRTHHLHVGAVGFKDNELRYRDILDTHSDVAADYVALKMRLAKDHEHDRETYTVGKTEFIKQVMARFDEG